MVQAEGHIKTDDLTLACVLIMHGYNPIMSKKDGGGCEWIVAADDVDEYAEGVCEEYVRGAVRVEPRRFMREMKNVRHDMYTFLGIGNKPRGERVRQRPRPSASTS